MIVWGTKKVYRHLGYVADFCPICVKARPFVLERVGMAGHLYYITAGEGQLAGYQLNCLDCNILLNGDPQRYSAFVPKVEPIAELIKHTFPNMSEVQHPRLLLEHQIRTDLPSIAEDVRRHVMTEPFLLLSPKVVKYFAETHFEMGKTFMRREIIPVLAGTLARLRPTEQQLQALLTRLVQMRDPIGARVKLADLMDALNARYAEAPPSESTVFGTSEFKTDPAASGKRMRPARMRAGGALLPYERAGKAFQILAWIAVLGIIFLAGGQLNAVKPASFEAMALFALLVVMTAGMFYASAAIMRHAKPGRVLGIVLAVPLLFWLPIGTVVGAYILWNLIKGWGDDDPASEYAI